jgi:hypothetical protein
MSPERFKHAWMAWWVKRYARKAYHAVAVLDGLLDEGRPEMKREDLLWVDGMLTKLGKRYVSACERWEKRMK